MGLASPSISVEPESHGKSPMGCLEGRKGTPAAACDLHVSVPDPHLGCRNAALEPFPRSFTGGAALRGPALRALHASGAPRLHLSCNKTIHAPFRCSLIAGAAARGGGGAAGVHRTAGRSGAHAAGRAAAATPTAAAARGLAGPPCPRAQRGAVLWRAHGRGERTLSAEPVPAACGCGGRAAGAG